MGVSDQIYETLKREIMDLVLEPGAPLSETGLVSRLGGSRTSVRQALQRLGSEGLVRTVPGRGAFVSEISTSSVRELFQMRECLEAYAARLAARSPARAALSSFTDRFARFAASFPPEKGPDYYVLTGEMDRAVLALADNRILARTLNEIWDQIYRVRRTARTNHARLQASVQEHIDIIEAIVAGDEHRAAEAVERHVRSSLENILAYGILQATGRSTQPVRQAPVG